MKGKHILRRYARVTCHLTGDEPLRFFNLCRQQHIVLHNLQKETDGYRFSLSVTDFMKTGHIRHVAGVRLKVTGKKGFPFQMHRFFSRRAWCIAVFAVFFMLWTACGYIWDIRISGNQEYSTDSILKYLRDTAVFCGMKKSDADTKEIASGLRSTFPHLVWVSAEKKGTVLYIRMEEARQTEKANLPENDSSLYADHEGYITSLTVRKGIRKVSKGDYVYPGQLLISGEIPLYDDGQHIMDYTYCQADGDVVLDTAYVYYDRIPYVHTKYIYEPEAFWGIQFSTPSQAICLHGRDRTGVLRAVSHQLKLSDTFLLPVTVTLYYDQPFQTAGAMYSKQEAAALLQEHFSEFFMQLAKKVLQISENNVKIALYQEYAVAYGIVHTRETTGISSHTPRSTLQERMTTTED